MKLKRKISKLHLYLSLPVGLIISIICFTGACMVFDRGIQRLSDSKKYAVSPIETGVLTIDSLAHILSQKLPKNTQITSIKTFTNPKSPYQFYVDGSIKTTIFVNQYTGEYLGGLNSSTRNSFYRTMFRLHRWLLVPSERGEFNIGKLIVGISTVILIIAILTGLIMWWPLNKARLKKKLSISITKGWRKFWYDIHVSGGVYITIWLLVLAMTGLLWSFPNTYRPAIYTLFGIDTKKVEIKIPHTSNKKDDIDFVSWQSAYAAVSSKNLTAYSYRILPAEVKVYPSKYGNIRASESNYFNTKTGVIEKTIPYSQRAATSQFMGLMYSIHTGVWGGIASEILTFFISLFGGILPLTGYYLWIKRGFKKKL